MCRLWRRTGCRSSGTGLREEFQGGIVSRWFYPLLLVVPCKDTSRICCCICESGSGQPLYSRFLLLMKVRQASRSSNMTVKHI